MGVSSTATANYSGSDIGGEAVIKTITLTNSGNAKYGLGVVAGYLIRDMNNTANTTATETLTGSVINLGARFYALNLYLGSGIIYSNFDVDYKGSTTTKQEYSAFGIRLETGIDFYLSKRFLFAPKVQYDLMEASQTNSSTGSNTKKVNSFGLSFGLGVRF